MASDNNKTPEQIERGKTAVERAQDVAYTTNHALLCTATDFIDPYFSNFIQKKLGNQSQLGNIWVAEVIGDFGAIPMTIGMQRMFPGAMKAISKFVEPAFHGAFESGAKRDAKEWAKKHNYSTDSKEYKERVERIYNYEVDHLPQALMWTASSVALNVSAQRFLGNKAPIAHTLAGKVGGSVLTAGITVGARALFPRKAEKLDKYMSEKFLLPAGEKIDDIVGEEHNEKDWSKRVRVSNNKEIGITPAM